MDNVQQLTFTWDGDASLSANEIVKVAGIVKEPVAWTEVKQAGTLLA